MRWMDVMAVLGITVGGWMDVMRWMDVMVVLKIVGGWMVKKVDV